MKRFIPTKIHGVLDYLFALTLILLPRVLGWNEPTSKMSLGVAILVAAISLITRYELGLFKLMPMQVHLAFDALTGLMLITMALASDDARSTGASLVLGVMGVFSILASLISKWRTPLTDQPHFVAPAS